VAVPGSCDQSADVEQAVGYLAKFGYIEESAEIRNDEQRSQTMSNNFDFLQEF
jgi:hypothetical protein